MWGPLIKKSEFTKPMTWKTTNHSKPHSRSIIYINCMAVGKRSKNSISRVTWLLHYLWQESLNTRFAFRHKHRLAMKDRKYKMRMSMIRITFPKTVWLKWWEFLLYKILVRKLVDLNCIVLLKYDSKEFQIGVRLQYD